MAEPVIEVRDLHQKYGDFTAVRGISFTVGTGEVFALLGTNGAGKTTTVEVLAGYTPPSGGEVRVFGADPRRDRARLRRRTGIMLQEAGFFGDLTVVETVDAWRTFTAHAMPTHAALSTVDLVGKAKTRVAQLSGGERRRLDLALAVLGRPALLFLDEPTTGLDPQARQRTWTIVADLVANGTTVLLTTHYLEEAERLADRVAILREGRVQAIGNVAELLAAQGGRVTFALPSGVAPVDLPHAGGVRPTVNGSTVTYRVADADLAAYEVLSWAAARRRRLPGLEVRTAHLDELFAEVAV